jgi:hypothetical protein
MPFSRQTGTRFAILPPAQFLSGPTFQLPFWLHLLLNDPHQFGPTPSLGFAHGFKVNRISANTHCGAVQQILATNIREDTLLISRVIGQEAPHHLYGTRIFIFIVKQEPLTTDQITLKT